MSEKVNSGYIPFLDGLRAVAVGLVIIFHYWSNELILPGGFVGVDVFFVISGFIITKSLVKECFDDTFSLKDFWIRRSKRLLPAVLVLLASLIMLSVILPVIREYVEGSAYAWFTPYIPDLEGELAIIKDQVAAVILYFINWQFIMNDVSYFEQMGRPSLLTHLWSLAIEEQFYIVWPMIISLIIIMCKKSRALVAACVAIPLCISVFLMTIYGQASPHDARAYYGTDCRAFALLFGALLAVFWDKWRETQLTVWQRCFFHMIGPCGLIIIVYLSYTMKGGELFAFQGGLQGAAVGSVMIIMAGRWHQSVTSRVLQNGILSWIGKRSYGLYLWHWPVFILTDPAYNYPIEGFYLLVLRLALLVGAVQLSYKFIEIPIRSGEFMKFSHTQHQAVWKFVGISVVSVMIMSCSAAVVTAKSDKGPYGGHVVVEKSQQKAVKQDESEAVLCEKKDASPDMADVPSNRTEEVIEPVREIPEKTEKPTVTDVGNRTSDKDHKSTTEPVLAIGDSVMLGAKVALESNIAGARVDAKVGRQFTAVLEIIKSLKVKNKIPSTIVIHSGTNGTINESQLVELMGLLSACKRVVIVNNYVPRSWQKQNNEILGRVVPAYPNACLVNWYDVCLGHKQFLYKDGIHIGGSKGAELYAGVIRSALQ